MSGLLLKVETAFVVIALTVGTVTVFALFAALLFLPASP